MNCALHVEKSLRLQAQLLRYQSLMDLQSLTVGELMTSPVVSLERELTLFLADWVMREKHIRHLPVVDDQRRVVGLVSHRTILAAKHSESDSGLGLPVADIMVPNPVAISRQNSAADAARFMVENQIGCALIVDEEDRLEGIVTESDFVELAAQLLFRVPRISVDDFMTTDVISLMENEPILIADELMRQGRFRHLPVVDEDGQLTGIVTHRDLLSAHLAPEGRSSVTDIVQRDVWTIGSGSSARNAARTLADHKFGCLPVTEKGKLIGLITEADILTLLVRLLTRAGAFRSTKLPLRLYMSSPVHCVHLDTGLEAARTQMSRRAISSLGVVSDRNHLVGIVTASDLVADDKSASEVVSDRMTREVVTVDIATSVPACAEVIARESIHRVFVVDEGRLIGVLSTTDVIHAVRDLRVHTPLSELMSPIVMTIGASEEIAAGIRFLETAKLHALIVMEQGWPIGVLSQRRLLEAERESLKVVEDAMSASVISLPAELPAFRAAAQMAELGVHHVVAIREGAPIGVVTSFDLAKVCARSESRRTA